MPNELEISRRTLLLAKARADLAEHEQCLKATEAEAENAALTIIGQYPGQQPSEPDIYMRSIRQMLTGVPLAIVNKITDPTQGIAKTSEFMPTIAALSKWLDQELYWHSRKAKQAQDIIFTLEGMEAEVSRETPEERAAHVDAALEKLGRSKKDQRIANLEEAIKPSGQNFGQKDVGWDKRMEALKNLAATKRVEEEDDDDTFVRVGDALPSD